MSAKKVYLFSLGAVLLASVYPIYMGGVMLASYIRHGGIDVANYPSYIIPYTPICIALIICAALLPLAFRLCKRWALPGLSIFGAGIFLAAETGFEQIAVFTDMSSKMNVEVWQMLSCFKTPLVRESVWDSLNLRFNPLFKLHFYAIALLIVLSVIGVIYGFYKMAKTQNYSRKKPLIAQLVCVLTFIGLCILACFTAFFRTGNIQVSPISAVLMTLFFLIFGITAGVYAGTLLYEKRKLFSRVIPAIIAMLITTVMYIGEMVMMLWNLFRLGEGFLFEPLGFIPLSPVDIATIIVSGVVTYFVLKAIRPKEARS